MSSRLCIVLVLCLKILNVTCKGNSSLTFVIDDTSSMRDDIDQVIRGSHDLLDFVLKTKSSEIQDLILVTFNDPGLAIKAKTKSKSQFIRALERIRVHGGGDCPEYSMSGIIEALDISRSDSYLYVFTDAYAKDYHRVGEVISLCERKQSQVIFVLTGNCRRWNTDDGYNVYYQIAKACSGSVIEIGTREVHLAVDMIKTIVDDKKTIISWTPVKPNFFATPVPFTLDEKTEYAIITVSGTDVHFDIRRSDDFHEPIVPTEPIMSSRNFKVVKLVNNHPGTYTAWVHGKGEVSIVVYGKTDLTFEYGFSDLVPKSPSVTSKQPIAGKEQHLSISVRDPEHEIDIKTAAILSADEKVLMEFPLKRIGTDFYVTDHFLPPETTFKVAVKGIIKKTGKPIVRVSKISVTPRSPDGRIPNVNIVEGSQIKVDYGSNISLTCEVSAYPKPKIQWHDSDGNLFFDTQSSMIEFPYKYTSNLKVNNTKLSKSYICKASNNLGARKSGIQINVQTPLRRVKTLPAITKAEYGKDLTLKCYIRSAYPTETKWYFHGPKDKLSLSADGSELTIKDMDVNYEGDYTCKVTLIENPAFFEMQRTQVKIDDLAPPKITASKELLNKKFIARCLITNGVPQPVVTWKFKGETGMFTDLGIEGETLTINNIQRQHIGSYQCIGKNVIGTDSAILTLEINESPKITTDNTEYRGVVGDKILVIPCNVTGYPDPTIIWKNTNNEIIKTGFKYVVKGSPNSQSLSILNPTEKDTGNLICEAINKVGTSSKTFNVIITKDVSDHIGNKQYVYLLENESRDINCTLPDYDSHLFRWYKNLTELTTVTGITYSIKNANESDDGNYTCRANTDNGSVSETFVVDVGYKPVFENDDPVTWFGDENDIVDCTVRAKPAAKVEWFINGEKTNNKDFEHLIQGWGNYTCKVSNIHGVAEKTSIVNTPGCLINRTMEEKNNPPFILNTNNDVDYEEPDFNNNEFMFVNSGQKMKITCYKPGKNTFNLFPEKDTIIAECDKEDTFISDGKTYKYSDLKCNEPLVPVLKETKKTCVNVNSTVIKIGFEVPSFVDVYEICYDHKLSLPNFGYSTLSRHNLGNRGKKWSGRTPSEAVKGIYYCGEEFKCCYGKGQLVNAADVDIGPPQISPLIDLNAVPVWKPCTKENRTTWRNVEEAVRSLLLNDTMDIDVWSGGSEYENVNVRRVPRYLWKVLKANGKIEEVVVFVNTPEPKPEDIKCKKPEHDQNRSIQSAIGNDSYTYLCSLEDFSKAFGVPMDTFM